MRPTCPRSRSCTPVWVAKRHFRGVLAGFLAAPCCCVSPRHATSSDKHDHIAVLLGRADGGPLDRPHGWVMTTG
jgi:hypothetical protein